MVPGAVAGVLLRSTWLSDEDAFAWVAGLVLVAVGLRLALAPTAIDPAPAAGGGVAGPSRRRLLLVGGVGGAIGSAYGIGGAALVVPWLVGVERLPVRRVAAAGLATTFASSVVGLAAFAVASAVGIGGAEAPRWVEGLAFGVGGAIGGVAGARLQPRIPVRVLQGVLGLLSIAVGVVTLW